MALEINKPDKPLGLVSDRPLYLAADKWTLVEQGDVKAAYGLVQAGGLISAEDAERLHLSESGGKVVQKSREEAYKAAGVEAPVEAEAPKAQWMVAPNPPPPPPPPASSVTSGATPQSPPTPPAAVPADKTGKATARVTQEEKKRLADRAASMSSGDATTPTPDEGEPLRVPKAEKPAAKRAAKTATKRGKAK